MIDGKTAKDVNEPVILVAFDDSVVGILKAGVSDQLAKVVAKVDTAAPAWVAFALPKGATSQPESPRDPREIFGAIYPAADRESRLVVQFATPEGRGGKRQE